MIITPLIDLLKQSSPLKGRVIAAKLGITQRELRATVNYIRANITPRIASGDFGYKWENDTEKIIQSMNRTRKHAISELISIKKQRKLLEEEYRKTA